MEKMSDREGWSDCIRVSVSGRGEKWGWSVRGSPVRKALQHNAGNGLKNEDAPVKFGACRDECCMVYKCSSKCIIS